MQPKGTTLKSVPCRRCAEARATTIARSSVPLPRHLCPQLDQARGRLVDGVSVENEMQAVYSTGDRRSSSASSSR